MRFWDRFPSKIDDFCSKKNTLSCYCVEESDAGERGECMGTFLGSYRLEKRSKSHGVSENSITIGIPIQMEILKFRHGSISFRSWSKASRKTTSRQGYLLSEAQLRKCRRHPYVPASRKSPLPGCKSAGRYPARRGVGEFQYFVNYHSVMWHTTVRQIIFLKVS